MKRLDIQTPVFWNACAFCAALAAPLNWVSPFSAALAAAAGLNGAALYALPGATLGCLLGEGGLGGALACLAAGTGAQCMRHFPRFRDSFIALWAFFCCLIPALGRYAGQGGFLLLSAGAVALVALAAAPVWQPLFALETALKKPLSPDERLAFAFLAATVIAGLTRFFAPLGFLAAGSFALLCASEGLLCACTAVFPAALALLLGGASALPALILLISAGAAGLGQRWGRWAQGLLFLAGLPLMGCLGWERELLPLFGAAVVCPLLPEGFVSSFTSRFFAHKAADPPPLRVLAARRHLPAPGKRVSGDTGVIQRLPGNRVLLALADGMGTGLAARRLSERAVRELCRLTRAALDERTAFRALNRLLLSGENAFSTLETCVIDLERGLASFHKCGSETAWVLRGTRVMRLRGAALPLGILPEAPPSMKRLQLQPGDTVFLATDGLVAALGGEAGAEKALLALAARPPREICARMLKKARAAAIAHPDDMSALCARLTTRVFAQEGESKAS